MREEDAFNPLRNELVEVQTCPACQRTYPVSPDGTTLVCPHCHAFVDDETSVFAFDTVPMGQPSKSSTSGLVQVVLKLPGDAPLPTETPIEPTNLGLRERPTDVENRAVAAPVATSSKQVVAHVTESIGDVSRPRPALTWQLLLSYASVMTFIALYLAWQVYVRGPKRDLLDLPDLAPPAKKEGRVTTLIYVPATKKLSKSHVLKLGESRQFGSVVVTPLRVSRGPIRFRYFDPEIPREHEPSDDVLRLHLRFDNVSTDQIFSPLDRDLVFTRETDTKNPGFYKANNFLRAIDYSVETGAERKVPAPVSGSDSGDGEEVARPNLLYVYDLSPESDWVVVDQNLDQELAPGSSVEVFVPTTEEGVSSLQGEWTWRLHFRKGYNPVSFRGVTTLLEVRFDVRDIQSDSPGNSVSRSCFSPAGLSARRCDGSRLEIASLSLPSEDRLP